MDYGPQLPPRLLDRIEEACDDERGCSDFCNVDDGSKPVIEARKECRRSSREIVSEEHEEEDMYGPELPPGFCQSKPENQGRGENKETSRVIGPSRPPDGLCLQSANSYKRSQEDETVVGPLPSSKCPESSSVGYVAAAFEARAKAMKNKLQGIPNDSVNVTKRETWMTELPPERNNTKIDMGPRTFRKREFDVGDRSVWTDTPADQLRKAQQSSGTKTDNQKKARDTLILDTEAEKDSEIRQHIEEYNKKCRGESLLDIHKRKQKEGITEGKESVRRPFNRETDLELPKLDSSKKRKVIERSSELSNRFGQSSFL